jgi:hypothetical protein
MLRTQLGDLTQHGVASSRAQAATEHVVSEHRTVERTSALAADSTLATVIRSNEIAAASS